MAVHSLIYPFLRAENNLAALILTLLHKNLRVIRYNISVNHWPKGYVVASWLDVLIHQLLVMFPLKAQHQFNCVLQVTAHLSGQHSSIFCWLKTDSPAGQSSATLGNGPLEEAW